MFLKNPSYPFTKTVKPSPGPEKNTVFLNLLPANGLSSSLPLKLMMGKSLLPDRLRSFKNEMPGLKKKILFKKSHCHIHATLRQRSDAVHKLRFQHTVKTLCRILNVNRSTYPFTPASCQFRWLMRYKNSLS